MNRRSFLVGSGLTIGGIILAEAIPVNRVYSFPKTVACLNRAPLITNLRIPDMNWESGADWYLESDCSLAKMEVLTLRQERRLLAALEVFKNAPTSGIWPHLAV